jgi:DNA-binding response OmpR family regulator
MSAASSSAAARERGALSGTPAFRRPDPADGHEGRILVVEDEPRIARLLTRALGGHGFQADCVHDGGAALDRLRERTYDLVLLDLLLPGLDGFRTLERIRALRPAQEVLVLSALADVKSKVRSFELGASDYVSKPVVLAELVARIRTRIGRSSHGERYLGDARVELDLHRRAARAGGRSIALSTREFFLLEYLMQREGEVCSRMELLDAVWGYSHDPGTNVVDVYVRRLRTKLGRDVIETVRNIGYCYGSPSS